MIRRQRGVALAIVVWFIAGMSLLVAGIVAHARVDTRTTQIHLARAKVVAAGDGAIHLAMISQQRGGRGPAAEVEQAESRHQLGELEVRVRVTPAVAFVDVNRAPAPVLVALFRHAGGLAEAEAESAADNVVEWRLNRDSGGGESRRRQRSRKFYSLEDMLRIDGVTRTLLDGIRDYAVAGSWVDSRFDYGAASSSMIDRLAALESGSVAGGATAGQYEADRTRNRGAEQGVYRADALVDYGGRTWLRRRWVKMEQSSYSELPWRVVRTEAPRVVGG